MEHISLSTQWDVECPGTGRQVEPERFRLTPQGLGTELYIWFHGMGHWKGNLVFQSHEFQPIVIVFEGDWRLVRPGTLQNAKKKKELLTRPAQHSWSTGRAEERAGAERRRGEKK